MAPSSFPRSGASKQPGALHVPLPRGLLLEITRHLDGQVVATMDALVIFTGRTGEPVRYTGVRRSFDAACRRLGLVGVMPHSLRASCASWVAESDGVLEAARRLGHSRSSDTTRHYPRSMTGGDAVVAEHLDAVRTGAREAVIDPVGPSEWARSGHDDRATPGAGVGGERVYPR